MKPVGFHALTTSVLWVIAATPLQCLAWGNEGHQAIGAIADKLLDNTPAQSKLQALLNSGETLASVSVWADCAKGFSYCHRPPTAEQQAFATRNPDHHGYHYTDVPIQQAEYAASSIGTTDHDVVQIIQQCIAVLKGPDANGENPHHFSKREAILLLAHMVGDIHQPLHVGAVYLTAAGEPRNPTPADLQSRSVLETQGGNKLHINGKTRVLHGYWDTDTVKLLMRRKKAASPSALADRLLDASPRPLPVTEDLSDEVTGWAEESLEAARVAFEGVGYSEYRNDLPDSRQGTTEGWAITLPRIYAQIASDVAAERILLAGKRLAAVIQAVLK